MSKYASLRENDTYSLVLFALYKMQDDPALSTMSELAYTLDHDNFLRLIEAFGGTTITIPSVEQIETLIFALMIFQRVDIGKEKFTSVIKEIANRANDLSDVLTLYEKLREILKKYEFTRRGNG